VETIGRIRREHLVKGKSIKEIARDLKISRNTVRKILRSGETSFSYEREIQPRPRLGLWKAELDRMLTANVGSDDGDRQMVAILATVLTDGLPAVEAACAQAMSEGVHSSDVIINILSRQRDPGPAATILTPDALRLRHAPAADCARYDQLRST
jgi:hypothetical protein